MLLLLAAILQLSESIALVPGLLLLLLLLHRGSAACAPLILLLLLAPLLLHFGHEDERCFTVGDLLSHLLSPRLENVEVRL